MFYKFNRLKNMLIALTLGLFATMVIINAAVIGSPLGIVGGLIAMLGSWCWLQVDRSYRGDTPATRDRDYPREFKWVGLSILCFVGGLSVFLLAVTHNL